MKKLIYVCDGCGKEITGDIFKIIPEVIDRKTEDYTGSPIYAGQMDKHYCAECTAAFISSLNMLPAAVPEEEAQKEEALEAYVPDMNDGNMEPMDVSKTEQADGWMERNKDRILQAGLEGREVEFRIGGRLFAIREKAQ